MQEHLFFSFDVPGTYVLSEIDATKERITKLETLDDQKSYELIKLDEEIQQLRNQGNN